MTRVAHGIDAVRMASRRDDREAFPVTDITATFREDGDGGYTFLEDRMVRLVINVFVVCGRL